MNQRPEQRDSGGVHLIHPRTVLSGTVEASWRRQVANDPTPRTTVCGC